MGERATIGQYYPGNSFLHMLDPRVKLVLTIAFMVSLFFVNSWVGYAVFAAYIFVCISIAGIPILRVLKGLKPIFMILIFTFVLNLWIIPGKEIWRWWIFRITEEGIYRAIFITIRIILLVFGTTLLTLTTSPLALTDGIESLLSPLKVIHFPSHEMAMMISIALRFIPTLFEESDKIMRAQKARGADFESGNVLNRAKAMIPLMVPLFLNALNRADELGDAMEARCYRGGECRTRLNPLRMLTKDIVTLCVGLVALNGLGILL
ncbi:MAG: energy-coupling factor transporter transmembrane component T [Peptoniphilaceae bacterium]|nr:energy-coupling factor transporter transmembrane component T [Peptoniphilaceae bacterium]MDY5766742.1 energy-coupling factor transporter transmembrane component T [Peptoniphilaceae bacterium]